jgi:hypothetical protein
MRKRPATSSREGSLRGSLRPPQPPRDVVTKKINAAITAAYTSNKSRSFNSGTPEEQKRTMNRALLAIWNELGVDVGVGGDDVGVDEDDVRGLLEEVSVFDGLIDSDRSAEVKRTEKLARDRTELVREVINKNYELLKNIFKREDLTRDELSSMAVNHITDVAKQRILELQSPNPVGDLLHAAAYRETERAAEWARASETQQDIQRFISSIEKAEKNMIWQHWIWMRILQYRSAWSNVWLIIDMVYKKLEGDPYAQKYTKYLIWLGICVIGFIHLGGTEACVAGWTYGSTCTPNFPAAVQTVNMIKEHAINAMVSVVGLPALPAYLMTEKAELTRLRQQAREAANEAADEEEEGGSAAAAAAGSEGGRKKRMSRSRPLRRRRKGKKTKKILKKRRSGSRKRQKGRSKHSPTRRSKHSPTRRSKM